ncbi:MAG: Yip1 family protein [Caldilineaceae bacterium]
MDFGAMTQTWLNVLTHPSEPTFAEERSRPQATLGTALIWVVIAAVVSGILGWLQLQMFLGASGGMAGMVNQMNLPPDIAAEMDTLLSNGTIAAMMSGGDYSRLFCSVKFSDFCGILHLIARLFGGTGEFGRFAYLIAAFQAPITIISAVLGFVPVVGGCVSAVLFIYGIVLTFFALKAEHALSDGKAIGVAGAGRTNLFDCNLRYRCCRGYVCRDPGN